MTEVPFVLPILREGLDPMAELSALRTDAPVASLEIPDGPTAWLVTRYDDVREVLGDAKRFSNDFKNLSNTAGLEMLAGLDSPGGLGMSDPPDHTRLRRFLTPEFTMRRLQRLIPRIEEVVAAQLDVMEAAGPPVDLVEIFAVPIPSLVIGELLGVPYAEREEFQKASTSRFEVGSSFDTQLATISESVGYLTELVAAQRKEPGDGLIGMLLREHGDEIDDTELAGLADGLLTGGHETTASMLSLGAVALLRSPEHLALLPESDETVSNVVEELLRYLSVLQVPFPRFAREDLVLAGQEISAGDVVICSLAAADRDPVLGADLDTFDPHRAPTSHLAFGHGIHRCIGAELGKMELRIAYPALVRRFPTLRLDVDPDEIAYRMFSIVYGVESLPVAW